MSNRQYPVRDERLELDMCGIIKNPDSTGWKTMTLSQILMIPK